MAYECPRCHGLFHAGYRHYETRREEYPVRLLGLHLWGKRRTLVGSRMEDTGKVCGAIYGKHGHICGNCCQELGRLAFDDAIAARKLAEAIEPEPHRLTESRWYINQNVELPNRCI